MREKLSSENTQAVNDPDGKVKESPLYKIGTFTDFI
jgi:hypothetical protein